MTIKRIYILLLMIVIMRSNLQFFLDYITSAYHCLHEICESRLNAKSGAVIGFLYGLVALVYFFICFSILQGPPVPAGQPICDGCTNWIIGYMILGFFFFFPVTGPSFITVAFLYPHIPADFVGYPAFALPLIYGTALGWIIGYWIRKRREERLQS